MARFTSSGFAARGSCFALAGGHSLPMHGSPLFPDQVCWTCGNKCVLCPCDSRKGQDMSASSACLGCSFRVLAPSAETPNSVSSPSYPYPLHFPRRLPCRSLGNLPACGRPLPCSARTQLCLDVSCRSQTRSKWSVDYQRLGRFFFFQSARKTERHKEPSQCPSRISLSCETQQLKLF